MQFSQVLESVGGWGKYQKILCLVLMVIEISSGYLQMLIIVINQTPNHRCFIPELDLQNVSGNSSIMLQNYIPTTLENGKAKLDRCQRYFDLNSTVQSVENCKQRYVYDGNEEGKTTAISEFNFVCGNAWKKPITTMALMLGTLFGSFVAGYFSDSYGRRFMIVFSIIFRFLTTLMTSFANGFIFYSFCLFCLGMGPIIFGIPSINLVSEMACASKRYLVTGLMLCCWSVGYTLVPLASYLVHDWRWFLRVISFTGTLYIPFIWFIPESVQWLLFRKRYKEAYKTLKFMAKFNGTLNENIQNKIMPESLQKVDVQENSGKTMSYFDLLKETQLLTRLLRMAYYWITVNVVYFTLSLYSAQMAGNPYVNVFLSGLVDIPGVLLAFGLSQFMGRPFASALLFGVSTLACAIITPLMQYQMESIIVYIAMISKLVICGCFGLAYLYTAELFPTPLRNQAVGFCSAAARAGGILCPYLIYFGEIYGNLLLYAVIAIMSLVATLVSLFLPETKGKPLPETVKHALVLNRNYCKKTQHADEKELEALAHVTGEDSRNVEII